ncbi:MAG: Fe(3+) ABC transporter substrate-binding protein [Rhodobacteraceae bacterium]|nr:Fe(3+) ABC transporter substrate-binding protein [Paracoccaceae bacterium]
MTRHFLPLIAATAFAAALPAAADEVNVYSYRQPELVQPLFDAFTAKTGIDVNVAFLNKGLVEKLVAEGKRSPADLVLTVDIARLSSVVEAGVTQPVDSAVLAANIPAEFRDPGNQWFGLTSRARVVFASKDRVADGEVTTYEDLADPKWQGRICIRSGLHAYNLALFASVIAHHGEDGAKAWLEGLKANLARKPQGNDRGQIKAVWAGECDIAIVNTYYFGEMMQDAEQTVWADSVRPVFAAFEGAGTHVNLSGMAMTAAAPNRDNALKLMEFLSSPEAQEIYAEVNFEYPVLPGTKISDTVAAWGSFTPDSVNLMELAGLRAAALRLVEEVHFDD